MIRVARVIARLNIGGPAIHVGLLASRLDPARFQTTLVYGSEARGEGSMRDLAATTRGETVFLPALGREISPLADAGVVLALARLFRRVRPHIVHTHTAKAGLTGRLAARLAGVPVVVHTFHGHVFHGYFGRFASGVLVGVERLLARLSDRIVTVSPGLRDELVRYRIAPPERIEVIPLGFDLQPFLTAERRRGEFRAELGLPPGVPLIGSVGRLVPVKNNRLLLDAARVLKDEGTDARFALVGDGECRAELEAHARSLGIADRVTFTGWRRDLAPIYADLDVHALTSVNEGTPVSAIEAMAAGCPVVATRVGGVPDVIRDGETGLLISSGDAAGLASAIRGILAAPDRACRLAEAARADASRRFTAEALIQNVESLYERLLRDTDEHGF